MTLRMSLLRSRSCDSKLCSSRWTLLGTICSKMITISVSYENIYEIIALYYTRFFGGNSRASFITGYCFVRVLKIAVTSLVCYEKRQIVFILLLNLCVSYMSKITQALGLNCTFQWSS